MLAYLMTWMQLRSDRRAVTAIEYGLIAALVAVVIIGGVTLVGSHLQTMFTSVAGSV
jgi:pilus assembly protein Flp/PilA